MTEKIVLSPKVKSIAASIPLAEKQVADLAAAIVKTARDRNLNLAGNIVAGLDVNGPIVSCDDSDLNPFKGSPAAIQHLLDQPGVEVTLMTGWDLTTMGFFRQDRLKVPVGIVGEYGMAYERNGKLRHLYPYDETEARIFISGVLGQVAPDNLKVAFQGNLSPGAGAIYIEGDKNGNLLKHALVKGRRPSIPQLYQAIIAGGSQAELRDGRVYFVNTPENMKGFYDAMFRKHPLISVRVRAEADGRLSFVIDENDQTGFTFENLKQWGEKAKAAIGRDIMVYEDFGVDLLSFKMKEGNYSKDSGLREYAREAFGGNDFMCAIIGDKKSDVPKNQDRALMFALRGSDAEKIVQGMPDLPSVLVQDVRDFALALAEAHRIAGEETKKVKVEVKVKGKTKKKAKKAKVKKAKTPTKKAKAKKPAKKTKKSKKK